MVAVEVSCAHPGGGVVVAVGLVVGWRDLPLGVSEVGQQNKNTLLSPLILILTIANFSN